MTTLTYAGVGARKTPFLILQAMESIGFQMSQSGWHLRSGYAAGADQAFGRGAAKQAELSDQDRWTMYLPWSGFNSAPRSDPRFITATATPQLLQLAQACHSHWDNLNDPARLLMARNVAIIAGLNLDEPVTCVIGWADHSKPGWGGTGHAFRVADKLGIPVFDLANDWDQRAVCEFVNAAEIEPKLLTTI